MLLALKERKKAIIIFGAQNKKKVLSMVACFLSKNQLSGIKWPNK